MKSLTDKVVRTLLIPLAAAVITGCATIPMSSLERTTNKAYKDNIKIYYPEVQYSAEAKEDLAIADDVLHGFPVKREITYNEDGSTKYIDTHFGELWGAKERAKFPDWKEKYKELAREADQIYGNNDGEISLNESNKVLSNVIEKAYPLPTKPQPKPQSKEDSKITISAYSTLPNESKAQENYRITAGLTNALPPGSKSQEFPLTINGNTGKPEEYTARDNYTEDVMRQMTEIYLGNEKIMKAQDHFFILQVENTKLTNLLNTSKEDYLRLQNETMRNLCKKVDADGNLLIDGDEAFKFYEKLREDENFRYIESKDVVTYRK